MFCLFVCFFVCLFMLEEIFSLEIEGSPCDLLTKYLALLKEMAHPEVLSFLLYLAN